MTWSTERAVEPEFAKLMVYLKLVSPFEIVAVDDTDFVTERFTVGELTEIEVVPADAIEATSVCFIWVPEAI